MSGKQTNPDLAAVPRWTILTRDGEVLHQEEGEQPTALLRERDVEVLAFCTALSEFFLVLAEGSRVDWLTNVEVTASVQVRRELHGEIVSAIRRVGPSIVPGNPAALVRMWADPSHAAEVVMLTDLPLHEARAALVRFREACRREGAAWQP